MSPSATATPTESLVADAPLSPPVPKLAATFPPHRLSPERYQRLVDTGFFHENEPIFLWHGQLVEKMGKGQPHNTAFTQLNILLCKMVPAGWHLRPEQPVALGDSIPEPDFSIVRGHPRDYLRTPPTASDTALLIEVADSSLTVDSGAVLTEFARYAIPEYWIVNLVQQRIEIYTDPTGPIESPDYRTRRNYGPDDEVPLVLDGRDVGAIKVSDVLP
jgi:Uma2 family endonuclease